jgi:hypothetical protein
VNSTQHPWAVLLPPSAALAAGALRLRTDIEVRAHGQELWLRGPDLTDDLDRALRKLPGAERFTVGADQRLIPLGARVPTATLPDHGWRPLSAWLVPVPQPAALAGELSGRVELRLVRTDRERTASGLVTTLVDWVAYATTAPAIRLRPLRFAAAADDRVLVWGTPLPPIPGRRYVEAEGLALPAGYEWSPPVEPAVLRTLLGTQDGELALFDEEGSYERIDAGQFAQATRSAARATVGRASG